MIRLENLIAALVGSRFLGACARCDGLQDGCAACRAHFSIIWRACARTKDKSNFYPAWIKGIFLTSFPLAVIIICEARFSFR